MPDDVADCLVDIVREAVVNACKHARAAEVRVTARPHPMSEGAGIMCEVILEQGVREVARGGVWYSSSIQPIIGEIARKGTAMAKLSDLQRYIVWCVAASWSYGRIADQLSFSEQYVREQVSRIYVALDGDLSAHEKAALVTWAREHGLGPDDPSPPPRPT